jgi:thiol:disulfide interchange protein DsbC
MRFVLFLSGVLLALGVSAATPEDTVRQAMSSLAPKVKIDVVQDSAVPGFYEAIVGGEFVYVTKDGKYVIDGNAYDFAHRVDLTASSLNSNTGFGHVALPGSCPAIARVNAPGRSLEHQTASAFLSAPGWIDSG